MRAGGGRFIVGVAMVVALGSVPEPSSAWPPAQPGGPHVRDDLSLCRSARGVPPPLLRRAIVRLTETGECAATDGLARIVDDAGRDALTRALAALAIGEIGCHDRGRHHESGLRASTVESLENATATTKPAVLRQAAVRALGRAHALDAVDTLEPLRASDRDPVMQFLAAQALTRITGEDHFDAAFRDDVIARYVEDATALTSRISMQQDLPASSTRATVADAGAST